MTAPPSIAPPTAPGRSRGVPPACASFRQLPGLAQANAVGLAALLVALSWVLWPAWAQDPELAHGRLMPVLFAILIFESRRSPFPRFLRPAAINGWTAGVLAVGGLTLIVGGGLYAAVLDWSHALVEALLAGGVTALLAAGWIGLADARVRGVPLTWSAGVGIALWPLAAPIPPGTYSRLAAALQQAVTAGVLQVLQTCGIAAYREGNVIELARTSVGVSEACSGVRGLVACLATGLFLSGALLTRPRDRAIVVGLAPLLALLMNFIRSLVLTLMANAGVNIAGEWHDATGYTLIGVTSLLLVLVAWKLQAAKSPGSARPAPLNSGLETPPTADKSERPIAPVDGPRFQSSLVGARRGGGAAAESERVPGRNSPSLGLVTASLALAGALGVVFGLATHPFGPTVGGTPDVKALLPAAPAGWSFRDESDLSTWSGVLKTDVLALRTYYRPTADGGDQITLYLAYWRPGQAPVSLVSSHTPDACWPGVGWEATPLSPRRQALSAGRQALPPAESRLFRNGRFRQYVWYWHLYGGHPIQEEDPYTLRHLLHLAWTYGYRHDGDQWFVRASSNHPWSEIGSDPIVMTFFERLHPFGL
jgi:exosortase